MRVLSLFDGMSCGRLALARGGINVHQYIASEIDKYAIKVSQSNWNDVIHLGDVRIIRQMAEAGVFGHVDLLIGGSPCQGFSFAGDQLAFTDPRSALFFEFVWTLYALKRHNPNIRFMLENVKMKKKHLAVITQFMGVEPVCINSALVSAQNRVRYYWCNWKVTQPADRGILLRDIIESGDVDREKSYCIDANYYKGGSLQNYLDKSRRQIVLSPAKLFNTNPSGKGMNGWVYDTNAKSPTLTTNKGEGSKIAFHQSEKRLMVAEVTGGAIPPKVVTERHYRNMKSLDDKSFALLSSMHKGEQANGCTLLTDGITYRKLTPIECERLQGVPDNYTAAVSNTQRYKMLGNGWQVDTIEHIFRSMFNV